MTEFSNLLKECRKTCGFTQYFVAKCMGIAKAEYAMYELFQLERKLELLRLKK